MTFGFDLIEVASTPSASKLDASFEMQRGDSSESGKKKCQVIKRREAKLILTVEEGITV